jgi:sterol desaturase/sphingolipid hydroxylase (fatty acid hydroxylase superfamily)
MDSLVDLLLGSDIPYITYAVPFFFLLIGVELVIGWATHRQLYRLNDSINDLSCGIIDQVVRIFIEVVLFAGYLYLFANFRLTEMQSWSPAGKWAAAIGLLFGVDLCFYWFHRIAHEYAAPWATHVVHHQSEEYNLTVALRQSALENCFAWVFYLPLAVIGFPPLWYAAVKAINLLYQFWVHTDAIGKLGPLEWFLNTPSHHRVHHARNVKYLDKNYAGMFIIWDRMFGTFQVEEEPPVYGLTRPLHSWNPLWANLHYWVYLFQLARKAPRWSDKIKVWFMPLGWIPPGVEPPPPFEEVTRETQQKYNPRAPWKLALYVVFQFVLVLAASVALMHFADEGTSRGKLLLPAAAVVWSLVNLGAMFEKRRWVFASELVRLVSLATAAAVYAWGTEAPGTTLSLITAWFGLSLAWFIGQRGVLLNPRRSTDNVLASPRSFDSAALVRR